MSGFLVSRSAFEAGLPDPYAHGTTATVRVDARPPGGGGVWLLIGGPLAYWAWRSGATARGSIPLSEVRAQARSLRRGISFFLALLAAVSLALLSVSGTLIVVSIVLAVAAVAVSVDAERWSVQARLTRDRGQVLLTGLDDEQVSAWAPLRVG